MESEVHSLVEKLTDVKVRNLALPRHIEFSVKVEDLNPLLDKFYAEHKPTNVKLKGFRPDKAPRNVIVEKCGGFAKFYEPLLAHLVEDAMKKQGSDICVYADLDVRTLPGEYLIWAIVYDFPTCELSDDVKPYLTSIKLEKLAEDRLATAVDSEIKRTQEVYKAWVDKTEPIKEGDRIIAVYSTFLTNKKGRKEIVKEKTIKDFQKFTVGGNIWWMPSVIGKNAGDEVILNFVDEKATGKMKDVELETVVKIKAVQEAVIPSVESTMEKAGFKSLEQWKEELRKRIQAEFDDRVRAQVLRKICDTLYASAKTSPIPEVWIDVSVKSQLRELQGKYTIQQLMNGVGARTEEEFMRYMYLSFTVKAKDAVLMRTLSRNLNISMDEDGWMKKVEDALLALLE